MEKLLTVRERKMAKITTKNFTCESGLPALITIPADTSRPLPAIVLMHERYGLVKHSMDLAERFAGDGFVCIAPDCFFKHTNQDALHAGDDRYDITDDEAAEHLTTAINVLESMKEVNNNSIAVKGVCQTGRHPLIIAAKKKIAAALVWYGAAQDREWESNELYKEPLADVIERINCPVLGVFGEADHMISLDHVRRFRNCFEEKRKTYSIHVLPGAPHGWLNDTMPGRYRREQAETAWRIQRDFLREVLSPVYDRNEVKWNFESISAVNYDFSKNVRQE